MKWAIFWYFELHNIIAKSISSTLTHQIGTFELDLQYSQTYEKPNLKSKISLSLFLNDAWFKFSSIKNSALSYWCGKPKKFLGLALKKKKSSFFFLFFQNYIKIMLHTFAKSETLWGQSLFHVFKNYFSNRTPYISVPIVNNQLNK